VETPLVASQLPLPLQIGVASVGVLGSAAFFSVSMAWLLVPRAWTQLIGTPFAASSFVAYVARASLLGYGPILLFVNAFSLAYLSDFSPLRWLLPLAAAAWVVLTSLNAAQLRAWLTGAVPIAHTAFADQAERMRGWASLAGVPLHAILVDAIADGNADNALVAGWQRPTLFLGAEMLAHTDWRQRDAVIGHELGHARMGHLRSNMLVATWRALLLTVVLVGLAPASLQYLFAAPSGNPADTGDLWSVVLPVLAPLALIVVLLVFSVFGRFDRRRRHRMELACDDFSASLTGDPLAMAVVLHTITLLSGIPLRQRSQTHPTFDQRVGAMLQRLYAAGPRADWAERPVPADIPFTTPSTSYTVPMDQAPPPAPVARPPVQPARASTPVTLPTTYPFAPIPAYAAPPAYSPSPAYAYPYSPSMAAPYPVPPYATPYPYAMPPMMPAAMPFASVPQPPAYPAAPPHPTHSVTPPAADLPFVAPPTPIVTPAPPATETPASAARGSDQDGDLSSDTH
jgi:Zn-dependent protease with chaperone function